MSRKIDIAGLKVDAITKSELLDEIAARIQHKQKTFVVTPYSEFLYASMRKSHIRELLNKADFSIADGIGVLWADLFLSQPLTFKNFYLNILQAWLQVVWTGAAILLRPSLLYKKIPEKIVGANLVWDLVSLAEYNNFSVYILGAQGDIGKTAAEKFLKKFPKLKIVGTSNKHINDSSIFSDITKANPDMILVAFSAPAQEQWIADNLKDLPASFAIGLGGTFDYIAGAKRKPPQFIRAIGLEWLYRLITQPRRVRRIFNATWGLIITLVRYKVYRTTPLRLNAAAVVINSAGKILLCKRAVGPSKNGANPDVILKDYWQFPQGGLDRNENHINGAKRELAEETGIVSVEILGEAKYINTYEWGNATRRLLFKKNYRFRGQNQFTVFFKFTGDNSEIKLNQEELVDYQWLTAEEVLKKVAPERRLHAAAVLAELAEIK